jgi:hypothetical protein
VQGVAAQHVLFGPRGRQDDHGYHAQVGIVLELGEHFHAAHPGKVQVEHDQARAGRVGELAVPVHESQRLLAVGHDVQRVADPVVLERLADDQRIARVILDQQDVHDLGARVIGHPRPRSPAESAA